ncbi:hypothetical protein C823_004019 [Eubacterium plexicaudatum ASF492]|uniref:Glycosyltransferase 2-like domain-containing protein n=1 Tax=Eubacterium plexicaudatum ASF492 TaxID=1235802 RepID=N2A0D0_9FIRM|nr:hypothetical protein C823_004019 [Eubacterium plexicaudatum ASF492]
MSSEYDVSIIIINYNGRRFIDPLFQSLRNMRADGIRHEIIVVNNGDEDHSISYLKENYGDMKHLKIVETGGNLGYAGGNNAGVRHAKGKYVVFLNNDTAVDPDWLLNLYDFMQEHPACGMVNAKLLFFYDFVSIRFTTTDKIFLSKKFRINGKDYLAESKFCKNLLYESERLVCFGHSEIAIPLLDGCQDTTIECFCQDTAGTENTITCCGKNAVPIHNKSVAIRLRSSEIRRNQYSLVQNAGNALNSHYDGYDLGFGEKDSEKFDQACEITGGCGASIMMLKEDFERCGGFDEKFFMYYEDMDLSFRLKKLGKTIMFCPKAVVRHFHTGSSGEWSPFFCYQVSRNKLLFVWKNISKGKFTYYLMRQIVIALVKKNRYQLRGCLDAVRIGVMKKDVKFYDKQKEQ